MQDNRIGCVRNELIILKSELISCARLLVTNLSKSKKRERTDRLNFESIDCLSGMVLVESKHLLRIKEVYLLVIYIALVRDCTTVPLLGLLLSAVFFLGETGLDRFTCNLA